MRIRIEIIDQALIITDVDSLVELADKPKAQYYYKLEKLEENPSIIAFYNLDDADDKRDKISEIFLSNAVNWDDKPFTKKSFRDFARVNLAIPDVKSILNDSDTSSDSEIETVSLLKDILIELRIANEHNKVITNEDITKRDLKQ